MSLNAAASISRMYWYPHAAVGHGPAPGTEVGCAVGSDGVSFVIHPRNPYAPTTHIECVRFFIATPENAAPVWWFGGGMDHALLRLC